MPSQNYFRGTLSPPSRLKCVQQQLIQLLSHDSRMWSLRPTGPDANWLEQMRTSWCPAHSSYSPGLDTTVLLPPNYLTDTLSLQHAYIIKLFPCPTDFKPEDKGSRFIWNIGICVQDYTVSQPTRPQPELIFNVSHCTSMVLHPPVLSPCLPSSCKRSP